MLVNRKKTKGSEVQTAQVQTMKVSANPLNALGGENLGQLEWIHVTRGFMFDKGQTKPWDCEDHMQPYATFKVSLLGPSRKGINACMQRLEQWENETESNKFQYGVLKAEALNFSF